jgi:hypothetical protein
MQENLCATMNVTSACIHKEKEKKTVSIIMSVNALTNIHTHLYFSRLSNKDYMFDDHRHIQSIYFTKCTCTNNYRT